MDSIASRVKSRRSKQATLTVTVYQQPQQHSPGENETIRQLRLKNMAKNLALERITKAHQAAEMELIKLRKELAEKDDALRLNAKAWRLAEKEAAELRQKVRSTTNTPPSYLRDFNEVIFVDGLKRFVNVRGDCVNAKGDYLGSFWWSTRSLVPSTTPPSDWKNLMASGAFVLKPA